MGANVEKLMSSILGQLSLECHSDICVQRSGRHLSRELRRKAWARDTNVGIFIM